ncbi:MAG TPA: SGNH/GDSL hydrolase family protein [Clostridiales bacterium]|nr:MAG: GDSL-like Lipase/Acylhydrolase [Firmicutes bacterium ADurb.Bin262]HOU09765.1 SGNH/GDSL hydrolase family protein [Clostridiales bacterium]HQH62655.1 SGNH/GDSL hydrolase family protein [Clostridiales bacterium]HQK72556.1 SGNH/GDSL hydrolase family protein [Clostridiales bacterium]
MFENDAVILFQGDSITDCGRSRLRNNGLGSGYVRMIAGALKKAAPDAGIRVLNRGISGNRAIDLVERWQKDCIDLQPDYLSILIGVNDTWRAFDSNDYTADVTFKARCRTILEETLKKTQAKIILLSPFLLDVNEKVTKMREDLSGKQRAVGELAQEYAAKWLDLDAVFAQACTTAPPTEFSLDGVHPTAKGHALIAAEWLKAWDVHLTAEV